VRGLHLAGVDPRAKLPVLLAYLLLFLLPLPLPLLAGYLATVLVLTLLSTGFPGLIRPIRSILPLLILVLLLTPPFHREGRVFLAVRGFPVLTSCGLAEAVRLVIRFTGITLAFSLFMQTTLPDELIAALRRLGLPFAAALTVTLVLRTIPRITVLYRNVVDAHSLRRSGGETGGKDRWRGRLARLVPELTSVLVQAVREVPILAMVLESRGAGRANPRSLFLETKSGLRLLGDLLPALLFALLLAAAALLAGRV
jgi:energy-coupling factor transport system permease protein